MPAAEVSINPVQADAEQATLEKGVNLSTPQRVEIQLNFHSTAQNRLTCSECLPSIDAAQTAIF